MFRIIGGDQKEYGPVTAEELRRWIAEGRLNGQSLVQAEGSGEWGALSSFAEFSDALRPQAAQALPSAASAPPVFAAVSSEQLCAGQPEVRIGQCLCQSWQLLTGNFGLLFGATAVAWAIIAGCQFIPLAGSILVGLLEGVLYGGVYLIFLRRIRGEPASVGEAFAGFGTGFVQLMLAGFLTKLLATVGLCCCLVVPGIYLFVAWVFAVPLVADRRMEFWSAMELSRKVVTRVWFQMLGLMAIAFLPVIVTYVLVQLRVLSAVLPAIQGAMSSGQPDIKHFSDIMLQVAKISIPLAMLFKFVLLLNLPFGLGVMMSAYEGLFGARTTPTA
jgi:uncharacterized membrane protein